MIDFENVSKNCEFRYQLLINNISDVMIEIDLDGTFTYLSPQVYDVLGYYPEDLVGSTLYDIINPVDLDSVKENVENFNESVETNSIDFQIKHKKAYYLHVSAKIAMVSVNEAKSIIILLRNITEKKEIEEKLEWSEEKYRDLYENAPVLMVLVDEERRVRKANKLAVSFANRSEEEMLGLRGGEALRCLNALNDPRGCGFSSECQLCNVRNIVLDTFKTNTSFHDVEARLPFRRVDQKKYLDLIVSSVPLEIQGEKLALVTISDISSRKEAETKYQSLFDNMLDGFAYCKIITDENNKFVDFIYLEVNDAFERLTGLKKEETVGKRVTEVYQISGTMHLI